MLVFDTEEIVIVYSYAYDGLQPYNYESVRSKRPGTDQDYKD